MGLKSGYFGEAVVTSAAAWRYQWPVRAFLAAVVIASFWAAFTIPVDVFYVRMVLVSAITSGGFWIQSRTWLPSGVVAITDEVVSVGGRFVARRADITSVWVVSVANVGDARVFVRLVAGERTIARLAVRDETRARAIESCLRPDVGGT